MINHDFALLIVVRGDLKIELTGGSTRGYSDAWTGGRVRGNYVVAVGATGISGSVFGNCINDEDK